MTIKLPPLIRSYGFSLILIIAVIAGSLLGIIYKKEAVMFKPFGDIFLNLLFTAIVPLVFFSISSAVASMSDIRRLGKIISAMLLVFVATGLIASLIMLGGVQFYPPAAGVNINLEAAVNIEQFDTSAQIVKAFTVGDFPDIISKKYMLALIIFSLLTGLAAAASGKKGMLFSRFLASGSAVMMKLIDFIMYYAPIGLCAYFAYLVGVFGAELLGSYMKAMLLYYPIAVAYFFIAFSIYVFIAGKTTAVRRFWINIVPPALTALATGSSMAAIPANLAAAEKAGIPKDIREVVIPIGATIHMEGSCLAAVLKIAFLFGLFQMDFTGAGTIFTALGIALLTGVVVSGIPGGGTIGELLIISLYGFPIEAFPIITLIGTLVDAPATMLNATGDNVAGMLVARILGGKNWIKKD
ncbi:MAG TPA: dicarboxylate/amino acid:cation symporter [Smithellaceae bacterium]|nr:dicarboxylate/amino acid:cation symporter [Smithellaceae bacterium]